MNILAIGAHPDDIEILCAGTLSLYAGQGHHVTIVPFTSGDRGDTRNPARGACPTSGGGGPASGIIGANLLWPGIMDEHVFPNPAQRRLMIDLLREFDPDVIFTHSPDDYHPDHRYVSQLVFDSYFQKGLPHIPQQDQPACRFGGTQSLLHGQHRRASISRRPSTSTSPDHGDEMADACAATAASSAP